MSRDTELQELFDDVLRARAVHRRLLGRRFDHTAVLLTRMDWLEALERYVVALDERRLPVPRLIHSDVEILRNLCRQRYQA